MKIICIGRNYADHAKELNNQVPGEPVIFLKPDSALLRDNKPFFHPAHSKDIHHELELVIRINRNGKHIEEQFAHRYWEEITLGIDFTARDTQARLKAKGLPWELAKGFDHSAVVGQFINRSSLPDLDNIRFKLLKNNELVQDGQSQDMLFSISQIIAFTSKYYTLKQGDFIFTGTPKGVGPVSVNDSLRAELEGQELLNFQVK